MTEPRVRLDRLILQRRVERIDQAAANGQAQAVDRRVAEGDDRDGVVDRCGDGHTGIPELSTMG